MLQALQEGLSLTQEVASSCRTQEGGCCVGEKAAGVGGGSGGALLLRLEVAET